MSQELSEIVRSLDDEFESLFELLRSSYSLSSFGDSVAEYGNKSLRVRFSRDRGEFMCEVANPDSKWVSIYDIFPNVPRSLRAVDEVACVKSVIQLLRERSPEILSFLLNNLSQ